MQSWLHKQGERAAEIVGTHLYVGYDGMFVLGAANQRSEDATGMHLTYYGNSAQKPPAASPQVAPALVIYAYLLSQLVIVYFISFISPSLNRLYSIIYSCRFIENTWRCQFLSSSAAFSTSEMARIASDRMFFCKCFRSTFSKNSSPSMHCGKWLPVTTAYSCRPAAA